MKNYNTKGCETVDCASASVLLSPLLCKMAQQKKELHLFNDVPLKCFSYNGLFWPSNSKNLSTLSGKDLACRFDYVICEKEKVVLCITVDRAEGQYDKVFSAYLPGVPHRSIPAAMLDDRTANWDKIASEILTSLGDGSCGFTLDPVLIPHSADDLTDLDFFTNAGFTTPYATASGLFLGFEMTDDGPRETLVTTRRFQDALLEKIHWHRDPGEDVMQAFFHLETMPMRCVLSDDEVRELKAGYNQLNEKLDCSGSVSSYSFTADLHNSIQYYWHCVPAMDDVMSEILHKNILLLAKAVLSSGSKLLNMPVRTLFEAAAFQHRSYHPLYIYELNLEKSLNLQDFDTQDVTLSMVLSSLLSHVDHMDCIYTSLYYLLVFPFV